MKIFRITTVWTMRAGKQQAAHDNGVSFRINLVSESYQKRFAKGARNLLMGCAGCAPGDTVLIVCETDTVGYYDPALGHAIKTIAEQSGLRAQLYGVPLNREVCAPSEALSRKMDAADCSLFLARLGDQIRFRPKISASTQVISYALDCDMLASPFGTIAYQAFETLRALINQAIAKASTIHVTCPAGTDFSGSPATFRPVGSDTTLMRFPVSVYAPVPAHGFRGCIAQNGFLTGTGSHYYRPWSCGLNETVFIHFEDTQITGFEGAAQDVAAAKAHYEFVGRTYELDTYHIHSWHGGIHPACKFNDLANAHFERWGGGAFGNPRLMHFHTCGAFPPGEIALNVLDPTVRLDGIALWENGRLHPERIAQGAELFARFPDMKAAFDRPETRVGQAASGQLSYV